MDVNIGLDPRWWCTHPSRNDIGLRRSVKLVNPPLDGISGQVRTARALRLDIAIQDRENLL